jgi:hypothetical protein
MLKTRRRAEFVEWQQLLPIMGTIARGRKLVKSVLRTDRFLKGRRVGQPNRTLASAAVGANSLLKTGKLKPAGAVLYGIDRTGKSMVKGYKRGGLSGAAKGLGVGLRNSMGSIQRSGAKVISPAVSIANSSGRAYRLLPESPTRRRKAIGVGISQYLKKGRRKGMPKKLYQGDKVGRNTLRRVRRWRRRRRR